jgi:hypothetical protein
LTGGVIEADPSWVAISVDKTVLFICISGEFFRVDTTWPIGGYRFFTDFPA